MFRTITLGYLLAIVMASSVMAAPQITSKQPDHDFGKLDSRQIVKHTFVLTNSGDEDLHIKEVKPACGCTTAALDKKVLAPGDSVDIKAQLSIKGAKGRVHKEISVESDDPAMPKLLLTLHGEAISPITVTPTQILFGDVSPAVQSDPKDVSLETASKKTPPLIKDALVMIDESLPLQVTQIHIIPKESNNSTPSDAKWTATIASQDDDLAKSDESGLIHVRVALTPGKKMGQTQATVRLHTDNADFPSIDIPVSAVIASEVSYSPESIVLLEHNATPVTRYLLVTSNQNNEGVDFKITKVTPPLPEIKVDVRPIGKRGYRIKLVDLLPTPDMVGTKIVIETNVPSMQRIEIPVQVIPDKTQSASK